ncbi:hypothetical protein SAMN04487760_107150 [Lachnospiraceae bacterium G41]|nr:hypothetical protein SAMN04487760_107150 [Lachnospiraceae bacterium G41]
MKYDNTNLPENIRAFFQVIATDDDYVDSASVLGLDSQEQLEALIDALNS